MYLNNTNTTLPRRKSLLDYENMYLLLRKFKALLNEV